MDKKSLLTKDYTKLTFDIKIVDVTIKIKINILIFIINICKYKVNTI